MRWLMRALRRMARRADGTDPVKEMRSRERGVTAIQRAVEAARERREEAR